MECIVIEIAEVMTKRLCHIIKIKSQILHSEDMIVPFQLLVVIVILKDFFEKGFWVSLKTKKLKQFWYLMFMLKKSLRNVHT